MAEKVAGATLLDDKARPIPFGPPLTEREKANVVGINEIWGVAVDLDNVLTRFLENVRFLKEGGHADAVEPRYWVEYFVRQLPAICEDNRVRLVKAAQLMAAANGVSFREPGPNGMNSGPSLGQTLQMHYSTQENFHG
jgi:hypothetical protein